MGRKTRSWEYLVGTLIAGDRCFWLENNGQVPADLKRVPLPFDDGSEVPPGTIFKKLDGPNTSGLFRTVDMIDPHRLIYEGQIISLAGRLVIFRQHHPEEEKEWPAKHIPCYWLIQDDGSSELMYMHHYNAPKIVQLSKSECEYQLPNKKTYANKS